MKISRRRARSSLVPIPSASTDGGTIIRSRVPNFALTTALSCFLTAGLLLFQGVWLWGAALTAVGACMGFWQTRILLYAPILIVSDPIATVFQEGEDASVFKLSDLTVVQGILAKGIVILATALLGMSVAAVGLSSALEASMSLSLSPTQRLLLTMAGVWLAGTAVSIAYLDFPRRKLLLRVASRRPRAIYIDSRRQREQLLLFLRARQLEEVMRKVGLGPLTGVPGHRDNDSASDQGNGATP
jgi:hypothetical protein